MVTLAERQKAEKLFESQKGAPPVKQKKKAAVTEDKYKGFSTGEINLYESVDRIKEREKKKTLAEEEKTKAVSHVCLIFLSVLREETDLRRNSSAN